MSERVDGVKAAVTRVAGPHLERVQGAQAEIARQCDISDATVNHFNAGRVSTRAATDSLMQSRMKANNARVDGSLSGIPSVVTRADQEVERVDTGLRDGQVTPTEGADIFRALRNLFG